LSFSDDDTLFLVSTAAFFRQSSPADRYMVLKYQLLLDKVSNQNSNITVCLTSIEQVLVTIRGMPFTAAIHWAHRF
jgi:hypothetical protein